MTSEKGEEKDQFNPCSVKQLQKGLGNIVFMAKELGKSKYYFCEKESIFGIGCAKNRLLVTIARVEMYFFPPMVETFYAFGCPRVNSPQLHVASIACPTPPLFPFLSLNYVNKK